MGGHLGKCSEETCVSSSCLLKYTFLLPRGFDFLGSVNGPFPLDGKSVWSRRRALFFHLSHGLPLFFLSFLFFSLSLVVWRWACPL